MESWHIIIPMAGGGSRLASLTGGGPKMLHRLSCGMTLLEMSVAGLAAVFKDAAWTFVARSDHAVSSELERHCAEVARGAVQLRIELLDLPTSGQLATVMIALPALDDRPVVIHNCDTYVDLGRAQANDFNFSDFTVAVFSSSDPAYSYCEVDEQGRIRRLTEKIVLPGGYASSGTYFVRNTSLFRQASLDVLSKAPGVHLREHYVSLALQRMLELGAVGTIWPLEECWPLGTPNEVVQFELRTLGGLVKKKTGEFC